MSDGGTSPTPVGGGLSRIGAATVFAGLAGYVVTWMVPRFVGFEAYAEFAVFWGFLFLLVSALSGLQQEVTRGTRLRVGDGGADPARFGAIVAGVLVVLLGATAPLWIDAVFPASGWELVLPVVVGAASYLGVAVVGGSLYGLSEWGTLFLLITVEAAWRLAAVAAVLLFTNDIVVVAWAVAVPFPLTILVLLPRLRSRIAGRAQLDVGYRRLALNVGRTVVAAASMGVLISGLPLLLGIAGAEEQPEVLGAVIITMTLTRAPLIVIVMALQSYLIVLFRDSGSRLAALLARIALVLLVAGIVLAAAAYLVGPPVLAFLFPGEQLPDASFIAVMVLSSAAVGLLCVSAPAVLARGRHTVYGVGWVAAAVVTIVCLALPIEFFARVTVALIAGPLVGLAINLGGLARPSSSATSVD